jgi:acyl-CoA synthetase (NDP forming)
VLLGYRVDPQVGPIVVLGSGGIATELAGDAVVELAPVSAAVARRMVDAVPAFARIDGYRGLPRGDRDALVSAIVAVSRLSETNPEVLEAEINPLLVLAEGDGVRAVDALVVVGGER